MLVCVGGRPRQAGVPESPGLRKAPACVPTAGLVPARGWARRTGWGSARLWGVWSGFTACGFPEQTQSPHLPLQVYPLQQERVQGRTLGTAGTTPTYRVRTEAEGCPPAAGRTPCGLWQTTGHPPNPSLSQGT